MAIKTYNYSLLQGFVKLCRLPWSVVTVIIAAVLLFFSILDVYFQGYFTNGINWEFWRIGLQPAIIVYIFAIIPVMQRLWERVISSLQILLPQNEQVTKMTTYNRRGEWIALSIGAVFAVVMSRPWILIERWSDLFGFFLGIIMFSLLALIIYGGVSDTLRLARLNRYHLKLDIFDHELLVPVARWSLSISLAFIGGTSLSVLFQPFENLQNVYSIIVYSILLGVTVLLFFTSMWSIHSSLASAKDRELAMVRTNLGYARQQLRQYTTHDTAEKTDKLYSAIAAWGLYERQVLEASTWPFNAGILKRLLLSTIAPILVYFLKIFIGLGFRF